MYNFAKINTGKLKVFYNLCSTFAFYQLVKVLFLDPFAIDIWEFTGAVFAFVLSFFKYIYDRIKANN